jgi:hypothetical protein
MRVKKAEVIMSMLKAGRALLDIQKMGTGKGNQFIATPL